MQTQIEPAFVLFFDCSEEEMERRLLSRNQVRNIWLLCLSLCKMDTVIILSRYFSMAFFLFIFSNLVITFAICLVILGWFKGREDDNIETIRKRFNVFLESSLPVIQHYESRGKVRKVFLFYWWLFFATSSH